MAYLAPESSKAAQGPPLSLTLYVAMHEEDAIHCMSHGSVPTRFVSPKKNIIGFRESPEAAVERYRYHCRRHTPMDQLSILRVTFSALGIAHYVTETCNAEAYFSSRLSKQTFKGDVDWGVWHFVGDLSLRESELLSHEWHRVE